MDFFTFLPVGGQLDSPKLSPQGFGEPGDKNQKNLQHLGRIK
jgi:hypothetical protein